MKKKIISILLALTIFFLSDSVIAATFIPNNYFIFNYSDVGEAIKPLYFGDKLTTQFVEELIDELDNSYPETRVKNYIIFIAQVANSSVAGGYYNHVRVITYNADSDPFLNYVKMNSYIVSGSPSNVSTQFASVFETSADKKCFQFSNLESTASNNTVKNNLVKDIQGQYANNSTCATPSWNTSFTSDFHNLDTPLLDPLKSFAYPYYLSDDDPRRLVYTWPPLNTSNYFKDLMMDGKIYTENDTLPPFRKRVIEQPEPVIPSFKTFDSVVYNLNDFEFSIKIQHLSGIPSISLKNLKLYGKVEDRGGLNYFEDITDSCDIWKLTDTTPTSYRTRINNDTTTCSIDITKYEYYYFQTEFNNVNNILDVELLSTETEKVNKYSSRYRSIFITDFEYGSLTDFITDFDNTTALVFSAKDNSLDLPFFYENFANLSPNQIDFSINSHLRFIPTAIYHNDVHDLRYYNDWFKLPSGTINQSNSHGLYIFSLDNDIDLTTSEFGMVYASNTVYSYGDIGSLGIENAIWYDSSGEVVDGFISSPFENRQEYTGLWAQIWDFLLTAILRFFIPHTGFFSTYFSEMKVLLETKLGFLFYPFDLILDILDRMMSIPNSEPVINIPDIKAPGFDVILIKSQTFNFNSILVGAIGDMHKLYLGIVDVILIVGFLNYCTKQYNKIFGGGNK